MGILALGIKAALKAAFKKMLNTERGKRFMEWLKEKVKEILANRITKIVAYLASLGSNAAIAVLGFLKDSVAGLPVAILAVVGAAFALLTLFLKKGDEAEEG